MIWKKIIKVTGEVESVEKNVYCLELDKLHYFSANNIAALAEYTPSTT